MNGTENNRRTVWIDAWKGMLILLVVFGHAAGGIYHFAGGHARNVLGIAFKTIYLFHMPAFFFVAGYLWRRHDDRSLDACLKERIRRLVIPYLFWGFVSAFVFVALIVFAGIRVQGSDGYYSTRMFDFALWRPFVSILHAGGWPNGEGFRCNSVLWFLPCMFTVLTAYDCLDRLLCSIDARRYHAFFNTALAVGCAVIAALLRFNKFGFLPWGLSRAPFFIIFFAFGRLVPKASSDGSMHVGRWTVFCGWLILILAAWRYPDLACSYVSLGWFLCSIALAVFGCLLSMWTAEYFLSGRCADVLSFLGVSSLAIMILHKFIMMPLLVLCWKLSCDFVFLAVLGALVVTVLTTVAAVLVGRILGKRYPWIFGERKK